MKEFKFEGPDCKRFSGYKPCIPYKNCYEGCTRRDKPFGKRILIINLDAFGNVLMTTAQLPPLKRKHPESYIAWLTLPGAVPLLKENQYIDEIFPWDPETWLILGQMSFDMILNADKSRRSSALTMKLKAKEKLGFGLNRSGQIIPLNPEAVYNYRLGLDDYLKFRINTRSGEDILAETFRLEYRRDEYVLNLTAEEQQLTAAFRDSCRISGDDTVIGFNTGCSNLFPNKKMTIEQHLKLIDMFSREQGLKMILLGGKEDTERNDRIYSLAVDHDPALRTRLFQTPTTEGMRRGMVYENAADVVITGDSFGMHLAIALKKHVLAWFGVSCSAEIDLYDRGKKFVPADLFCSPCWKKQCPYDLECIKMIDIDGIFKETLAFRDRRREHARTVASGATV